MNEYTSQVRRHLSVVSRFGSFVGRSFMDRAACRADTLDRSGDPGPDWFADPFSPAGQAAVRVCAELCPVRAECLRYALETAQAYGIWGGVDDTTIAWIQRTMPRGATPAEVAASLTGAMRDEQGTNGGSQTPGSGDAA